MGLELAGVSGGRGDQSEESRGEGGFKGEGAMTVWRDARSLSY